MLVSNVANNTDKAQNESLYFVYFVFEVHTNIERYLVVTRTGCVKSLTRVSDSFSKYAFDKHVYIFGFGVKLQAAVIYIDGDELELAAAENIVKKIPQNSPALLNGDLFDLSADAGNAFAGAIYFAPR